MSLAAVTVHYGSPDQTRSLLAQLESYDSISSIIVVLHDDLLAPARNSRAIFVRAENRGYGAGINLAMRQVSQKFVLVLNPDVGILESQIAQLLKSHLDTNSDCTFPAIAEGNYLIHGYQFTRLGTMRRVESEARFFPGTCFLVSREAWQKAGGFNEKYFHYYEDADFCLRLEQAGCRIHHEPSVVIQHQGKSGADYPSTSLPRYAVRNHLLFLLRLGKLNTLSFANVTLRHLLYLFRWKHGWRGVGEWFRGIQEFWNQRGYPAS